MKEVSKIYRVVSTSSERYVISNILTTMETTTSSKFESVYQKYSGRPLAGDFVMLDENNKISIILKRKTEFCAESIDKRGRRIDLLASNVDQVFVVISVNRSFELSKLSRLVKICRLNKLNHAILVTKIDTVLYPNEYIDYLKSHFTDVNIIATSLETGEGLDKIAGLIKNRTTIFIGPQDGGKSSIIQYLVNGSKNFEKRIKTPCRIILFRLWCGNYRHWKYKNFRGCNREVYEWKKKIS